MAPGGGPPHCRWPAITGRVNLDLLGTALGGERPTVQVAQKSPVTHSWQSWDIENEVPIVLPNSSKH